MSTILNDASTIVNDASRFHSEKAFYANKKDKHTIDAMVMLLLIRANRRGEGLNATEVSTIMGLAEHKSIGASLSRCKKKYPHLVYYRHSPNETHGKYYYAQGGI